ncbi:MAG: TIGR00730 family Rossman fold protein [Chthoniobacteraceae bacterium]
MQDFTAGGTHSLPNKLRKTTGNPDIDRRIRELVATFGCEPECELIEQLVMTNYKLAKDKITTADLKMLNRSMNELRYAARVFANYRGIRKVSVFGSARTAETDPAFAAAAEFAEKMVGHGFMIITGGGDGIMGAAQRGAGAEKSFGLNIRLPFEQAANPIITGDPKLITFNYFFTRKLNFVKESHAIVLFPGGFGTMDEGFEALTLIQTGKSRIIPLVLVDAPGGTYWQSWLRFLQEHLEGRGLISAEDFALFHIATSVDDAVEAVRRFYRNYHSYRWVGHRMIIRIHRRLSEFGIEKLNADFDDLLASARIAQGRALPEEKNEPDLAEMPRLILHPHQRNFGRLRMMLDAINEAELEEQQK